nr:hypothetical protein HK105_001284 [Polyrhizophydium stewartii]
MPPKIIRAPKPQQPAPAPEPAPASGKNKGQKKSDKAAAAAPAGPAAAAGSASGGAKPSPAQNSLLLKQQLYGASWTGKTPLNLLHEHCQKSGWQKAILEARKAPKGTGWLGVVRLSKFDKKTGSVRQVSWRCPTVCESEQEAKHTAATYGLHRVSHNTSAYRLLPPSQRDLWLAYETDRKQTPAEVAEFEYAADPFAAQEAKERLEEQAARERERAAAEKEKAQLVGPWLEYPPIGVSQSDVRAIEELIRSRFGQPMLDADPDSDDDDGNGGASGKGPSGAEPVDDAGGATAGRNAAGSSAGSRAAAPAKAAKGQPSDALSKLVRRFVVQGFREAHVREAVRFSNDPDTVMEWLCAHVPDDDFPEHLGRTISSGISSFSHTTASLAREYAIQRLNAWGFPRQTCEIQFDAADGNELAAFSKLCRGLLGGDAALVVQEAADLDDCAAQLNDEIEALESIFGAQVAVTRSDRGVSVTISLREDATQGTSAKAVFAIPAGSAYPYELPAIGVQASLPAYIRLSLVQRMMREAAEMIGSPMIYSLTSLIEDEAAEIVKNPPPLAQLALYGHLENRKRRIGLTSEQMLKRDEEKKKDPEFMKMVQTRQRLPSARFKDQICKTLECSRSLVLCGETGCGKSTQVGQFILEHYTALGRGAECSIICTQPRKISAISLARRVSDERCESLGDSVGYAVRGENARSDNTRLLFCTTGILLRMLLNDSELASVTHVMVDEVHERSVESDFLLILLRDLMARRKDLRVILMSATIDADTFSSYFGCGVISIPGFTHPVTDIHLERILKLTNYRPDIPGRRRAAASDVPTSSGNASGSGDVNGAEPEEDSFERFWGEQEIDENIKLALVSAERSKALRIDYALIAATVSYICSNYGEGSILIFLPGALEIKRCIETLKSAASSHGEKLCIYPLHANLTNSEQSRIFLPARKSERKIIVATNIAETSITIDDVVFVIDSGKVKELTLQNNVSTLAETWCSRAACKQRRGRAGRVKPGVCFKLFSSHFEQARMSAHSAPEILRVPLEQLCLQIRAMGVADIHGFLSKAITPPEITSIDRAVELLTVVSALDQRQNITHLGRHMAQIPADLRLAKMLVFGAIFQCLSPILTIVACLTEKNPFVSPSDPEQQALANDSRKRFAGEESDNYLSYINLSSIADRRTQFAETLSDLGYIPEGQTETGIMSAHANDLGIVKSIVVAGLYPNIATIKLPDKQYDQTAHGTVAIETRAKDIRFFTKNDGRVFIHPSSVSFGANRFGAHHLAFSRKLATSKIFIMDPTPAPPVAILLFGGKVRMLHNGNAITVGDLARFRAFPRVSALINGLRRLLDVVLEEKFADPSMDVMATEVGQCLARVLGTSS